MRIKMNTWLNSDAPIIFPNPNRDFSINPISPDKTNALCASVRKTDFWDNLVCRPVPGCLDALRGDLSVAEYLSALGPEFEVNFPVQICYGHNRIAALVQLNWPEINIPVKDVSDENMLLMMAHENHGEWASNGILVMIETVRKVRDSIMEPVTKFETFEEYVEAGNTFFADQQAWKNARSQGIGYRKVLDVLGDSWSEGDVRPALNAIEMVADGTYTLTDIGAIPSAGVLKTFNMLAKSIRENETWPKVVQDDMITESAKVIKDPEGGATMKSIKLAAGHVKQGNDPVVYLKKGKPQQFNVAKAIESLMIDSKLDVRALPGMDKFEEIIKKVEAKIEATGMRQQQEAGATTTTVDEEGNVVGNTVEPAGEFDAQGELESAVYGASGSGDSGSSETGLTETEGGGFSVEEDDPLEIFTRAFINASAPFVAQAERLLDVTGTEELAGDQYQPFYTALDEVTNVVMALAILSKGSKAVKEQIETVEKKLAQ